MLSREVPLNIGEPPLPSKRECDVNIKLKGLNIKFKQAQVLFFRLLDNSGVTSFYSGKTLGHGAHVK